MDLDTIYGSRYSISRNSTSISRNSTSISRYSPSRYSTSLQLDLDHDNR